MYMYMYVCVFVLCGWRNLYLVFWSVYCVSCLSGLGLCVLFVWVAFLSFLLLTQLVCCMYMHVFPRTILYSLKNECFRQVVLRCFAFLLLHVHLCM